MCGLVGGILKRPVTDSDVRAFRRAVRTLSHRGPDAEGLRVIPGANAVLGFRRLSIEHRAVVVLYHYMDLPIDQVAEALGIPPGTVRSRLHYAMHGLRAALEADARPATEVAG